MNYEELKSKIFNNPSFKDALKTDLNFEISQMVIDARVARGLTQKDLADLVGTQQPSIARIESGNLLPTITFLEKIAKALKTNLIPPKFELVENLKVNINSGTEQSTYKAPVSIQVSHYFVVSYGTQESKQGKKDVVFNY